MSAPVAALARKVFEEYSRAGGNPPDAHFDRNAAEQWMAHALEFAGVAELIEAADNALVALGRYAEEIDGDSGDCLNLEQLLANGGEPEYVALRDALARVRGAA